MSHRRSVSRALFSIREPPLGNKKIILDVVMGAIIPLSILDKGEAWLGMSPRAVFITAGLIPAVYVLWDVLFYSKRFNAITSVIAITAMTQGGLAFLQVDGWKYALADSAGTVLTFFLFAALLITGRPILQYFLYQSMDTRSPEEEYLAWRAIRSPAVYRAMVVGMLILLAENLLRASANFALSYHFVTATFGTPEFNAEKKSLESFTRFLFIATSMGGMIGAFILPHLAMEKWLDPVAEEGGTLFEQIKKRLALDEKPTALQESPLVSPTVKPSDSELSSTSAMSVVEK